MLLETGGRVLVFSETRNKIRGPNTRSGAIKRQVSIRFSYCSRKPFPKDARQMEEEGKNDYRSVKISRVREAKGEKSIDEIGEKMKKIFSRGNILKMFAIVAKWNGISKGKEIQELWKHLW